MSKIVVPFYLTKCAINRIDIKCGEFFFQKKCQILQRLENTCTILFCVHCSMHTNEVDLHE